MAKIVTDAYLTNLQSFVYVKELNLLVIYAFCKKTKILLKQ